MSLPPSGMCLSCGENVPIVTPTFMEGCFSCSYCLSYEEFLLKGAALVPQPVCHLMVLSVEQVAGLEEVAWGTSLEPGSSSTELGMGKSQKTFLQENPRILGSLWLEKPPCDRCPPCHHTRALSASSRLSLDTSGIRTPSPSLAAPFKA